MAGRTLLLPSRAQSHLHNFETLGNTAVEEPRGKLHKNEAVTALVPDRVRGSARC